MTDPNQARDDAMSYDDESLPTLAHPEQEAESALNLANQLVREYLGEPPVVTESDIDNPAKIEIADEITQALSAIAGQIGGILSETLPLVLDARKQLEGLEKAEKELSDFDIDEFSDISDLGLAPRLDES